MKLIWNEIRLAVRILVKNPVFSVVSLVTLALGVGANTAIFSVVNAVLVRPLPFPKSDQLVYVFQTDVRRGIKNNGVSYPNLMDWSSESRKLSAMAGYHESSYNLSGQGEPVTVYGADVSSELFHLLGVPALRGRILNVQDENSNVPVAVIGEDLWRNRFNADTSIVGKIISLNQQGYTVVGVMPTSFQFPYNNENRPSIWVLLNQDPAFKNILHSRGGHYLSVVARMSDGIKLPQAQDEMAVISKRLEQTYPENAGWGIRLSPMHDELVGDIRTGLLILLGAVGMVLLIACANIINLLLVRFTVRQKELAIRTALGASRMVLARQIFMESTVLSLIGGGLGLCVAFLATKLLMFLVAPAVPHIHSIGVDSHVLIFTLLLSLLVAVLASAAQLIHGSRFNFIESLNESARGASARGVSLKARNVLVVSEVALAMMLMIGAGLLIRSFSRLQNGNPGFSTENIWIANVSLPRAQYSKPVQWTSFYDDLLQRVQSLPGVHGAAATLVLPLTRSAVNFNFAIEGQPQIPGVKYSADYSAISPTYFGVMNIPLIQGRAFAQSDNQNAPAVAIVNQSFVRQFFGNEDPIGKQVTFGFQEIKPRQIVGVVGNTKIHGMEEDPIPVMYAPYEQTPWWVMSLVVRTSGNTEIASAIRQQISQLDRNLPIESIEPMTAVISDSVAQPRFRTFLLSIFAVLALMLAAIGIYGIISYSVTQRTQEIGIRMALGATKMQIMALVMSQALRLMLAGFLAGLIGAFFLTRLLSSLLYRVKPGDPLTFVGVTLLLGAISILASYIPARRAIKFSPISVLRN
jgi:putative ABC transport system permease protein